MTTTADDTWVPLHEWEPTIGEIVHRWNNPTDQGVVVQCNRYGHFADPYWRASVRWRNGFVEHNIETSALQREDGSQ